VVAEHGYTTLVSTTGRHPQQESTKIGALIEQRVAGSAMLQFNGDRQLMAQLIAEQVPVVMVSCWVDYVDCDAFERALLRHAIPFHPEWVIHGELAGAGAEPPDLTALFAHDDHPGAIVATNDNVAIALIEQLEARGRRVPDDVSIVGFDGSGVGAHPRIGLTTVAQPVDRLVDDSVALLFERLRGAAGISEQRHIRLEPTLIVRASTAPARR
jgi:DNA-binding LacI/PurR family transcriptional regulator